MGQNIQLMHLENLDLPELLENINLWLLASGAVVYDMVFSKHDDPEDLTATVWHADIYYVDEEIPF